MNESIKNILKSIGLYYPLQSFYRGIIFSFQNKKLRRQFMQYEGRGYTCNVCGSMYQKFVPDNPLKEDAAAIENNHVVAGYGENIFCPNCMSTARERLLIAYLKDKVDVAGKKILHLSPEKNIYQFLKEKALVTTADLLPGFYRTIDGKVQKQDATCFSFHDNSFDLVVANHILEHIPDDSKAMQEILRVMKPGAMAILQVPYSETLLATIEDVAIDDPAKQSALYGQKDHVRIYSLNDYLKRLKETGFLVEVLGKNELKTYIKFATQPDEKLFLLFKKT
ncbi:MAG: methyltransferase domain-containing protein [Ferruginibacter sp.]